MMHDNKFIHFDVRDTDLFTWISAEAMRNECQWQDCDI